MIWSLGEKRDSMVDTAAMPLEKANPNFPFSIFAMVFSSSSLSDSASVNNHNPLSDRAPDV